MPDTTTTTRTTTPVQPATRPYLDPDTVRQPERWCDQQTREGAVEAAP
jgi:hypothetical protein